MSSPSLRVSTTAHRHLGFNRSLSPSTPQNLFTLLSFPTSTFPKHPRKLAARSQKKQGKANEVGSIKVKGKPGNVWSVDNELAAQEKGKPTKRRGRRRVVKGKRSRGGGGRAVLVSGAMLMEVETVLQTQEPVIRPSWNTFSSSVSGIWKGVGAVFSPITAEMEPIDFGSRDEQLYDCYTLSRIEAVPSSSGGPASHVQRKINWVTLNPHGEKSNSNESGRNHVLPQFEAFNFERSDVMEEDVMGREPGLVFFEDGSYSRGPVDIPVGEVDDSNYYLSPTFKFEQCLVKGCHKRLRIVHTIEFSNGGSNIQIMRVAVYEEQWVSPVNLLDQSDSELDLKPFSQRKRTQSSELAGPWKVFEVSATPIYGEEMDQMVLEQENSVPYVYLCTEALKKRSLPGHAAYFGEEEMLDMQDATMLWLPGGVTAYVDVNKDGILCIGVGWYSDEGINLVMERDYGIDGKLKDIRSKSEMKRRWSDPQPE
ncbi:putative calycin [Rosa chinensis]|uniref:Putative calycin n=1 Tax=Rosa chinensis TaxID=74649 RepID=A0A2P6SFF4_ROSCH|nr:uncharacterized protein LOC112174833 [Rosa chinensis]PRQ57414.1 putative calycin [Rosa chinensis]